VLQSTVHTVGGVITAGDAIMMIVPQSDDLQVEPRSIRRTSTSCRSARRRCCGCRPSTAHHAELNGVVSRVSPDVTPTSAPGNPITPSASRCRRRRSPVSRRQADPGMPRKLRADRRPHHAVVSDQAAQRPADARVPGEVRGSPLARDEIRPSCNGVGGIHLSHRERSICASKSGEVTLHHESCGPSPGLHGRCFASPCAIRPLPNGER